jgi:DNA polymerase-3 subunit delta
VRAAKGSLSGALDRPDPKIRFYLFLGPDEAQSRALASRLLKSLGAEKFAISGSALKSDPALLADEAAAIGLFGGKRLLWIEPAGEEIGDSVRTLLELPAAESAAVAIAGDLKKSSALRKLGEGDPAALAHISYAPEGDAADRMVEAMARAEGLTMRPGIAARIAAACGNDRAVVAQELAKLATYLDAAPGGPKELDGRALDEIGADLPEGGFTRLADLALSGDLAGLADELAALSQSGMEAVPVVRSLQRRLLAIAPLRGRVEAGEKPGEVMASAGNAFFWKDKPVVGQMIQNWDAKGIARVATRLGKLERDLMLTEAPRLESLGEELAAIARAVRRR